MKKLYDIQPRRMIIISVYLSPYNSFTGWNQQAIRCVPGRPLHQTLGMRLLPGSTLNALWWLEVTNNTLDHNIKKRLRPFTFDYKALYDSLSPDLVFEALAAAMEECRDQWSEEKRTG